MKKGIRNTTTVFDAPQRDRVRKVRSPASSRNAVLISLQPRHIPMEGFLEPYSRRKALGQSWMRDLSDGKYRKEFYIAHIGKFSKSIFAFMPS